MKKILITGCAGFIGSSAVNYFLKKNFSVIGIDDLSTGNKNVLPTHKNFRFIKGDCANNNDLKKISEKIDIIIHLAGQSSGELSFYNPLNDLERNFLTTVKLVDFYLKKKSKQFIYASSMSVYGNYLYKKVKEDDFCKPISFYGLSKLNSENYIKMYSKKKINYTILRLFNVYGPGQKLNNLKQGIIRIYLSLIKKNKKLVVKGSKNRFRDFIHIFDLMKILYLLCNNKKAFNKTYNICNGKKYKISEITKLLKRFSPQKFKCKYVSGTPLDQFGICGNNQKLINELNYKPKIKFVEGLRNLVNLHFS